MTTKGTFLLGVGAPKAGTSWLHAKLARHPQCNMGFIKEYHVFDVLHVPDCIGFRERTEKTLRDAWRKPYRLLKPRNARFTMRMWKRNAIYKDPERYFDYFASLLEKPGVRLTGDITPAYAALPEEALVHIRDGFAKRGIDMRVVYLMRDPVERCWSAVRMHRQRPARSEADAVNQAAEEASHLESRYRSERFQLRGNYHETLARLHAVFRPEQLYIQLYEQLFSQEEAQKIAAFLGLDELGDEDLRVNTTRKEVTLPSELREDIARFYAPAYEAAAAEFSPETILALWPSAAGILKEVA